MGNCCASDRTEYTIKHIQTLIRIQSAFRTYRARKQLKQARNEKIKSLFSNSINKNDYARLSERCLIDGIVAIEQRRVEIAEDIVASGFVQAGCVGTGTVRGR